MEDQPRKILRLESRGHIYVTEATSLLGWLETAYNGTLVFLNWTLTDLREFSGTRWSWHSPNLISGFVRDVSPGERLILRRVQLASPGSWDFLGIANVLGVIREYLKDRAERRKDKKCREAFEPKRLSLENDRLSLENEIRKNEVIAGRLRIASEFGLMKKGEMSVMLRHLVVPPLLKLGEVQDRGLITGVREKDIDDE